MEAELQERARYWRARVQHADAIAALRFAMLNAYLKAGFERDEAVRLIGYECL